MVDTTYQPKVYLAENGDKQVIASGGIVDVESGGSLKLAGTAVAATAAEINKLASLATTAAELAAINGIGTTKIKVGTHTCVADDDTANAKVIAAGFTIAGAVVMVTRAGAVQAPVVSWATTNLTVADNGAYAITTGDIITYIVWA